MSQFCRHGREVYCPKCEDEAVRELLEEGSMTPSTQIPSIDGIDPVVLDLLHRGLEAGVVLLQAEKEGDPGTLEAIGHIANGNMFEALFTQYRNFVLIGADKKADSAFTSVEEHHKALGAIGLSSEGGEVLDLWKKQFFHTKQPENYRDKVVKELGDVLWYFILKANAEGVTMDEIVYENMKKLVLRYPERHPELVEMFKGE